MLDTELHDDFGISASGSVLDDALATNVNGSKNYAGICIVRNDCPLVIGLNFLAVVVDIHLTRLLNAVAAKHIVKLEIGIATRWGIEFFADVREAR